MSTTKKKTKKQNFKVLIHGMDEDLYNRLRELADKEKRSVGKQAEYLIEIAMSKPKP